ncbi:MAG: family 20 glycosylhydrolase [Clostridia bacterium]|nr:family 20 glycosylhydrolase [Clostridia bacterium]
MIFHPQRLTATNERFVFSGPVHASAHPCLHTEILKEFWHNFSLQCSSLLLSESDDYLFAVGNTPRIPTDGAAYSIHIDAHGFCVYAHNEKDLLLGVMTLLDRFHPTEAEAGEATVIALEGCRIQDSPRIPTRMVHFCVFPETELWELQRFLRFCAALKYTHVVLEFWGMLRYDCLRELSWAHAFSKEQIKPILQEAKDLGLEIVPMFNHWGHASAGRLIHGKHVVLDQNPGLQPYFSEDGWCWDVRKPKVKQLLRRIREELIDLCGEGSYFHIGCDEAFNFEFTRENLDLICGFINEVSGEIRAQGRQGIAWGDMLLYHHPQWNPNNKYICNAPSPEVEAYLLEHLSHDILLADWQYDATEAPVETVSVFQAAGFDCLLCPWDRGVPQLRAVISTTQEQKLTGFLHTTWHTLSKGLYCTLLAGVGGFESIEDYGMLPARTRSAALLRRVMPCGGDYEKAGWSRHQVGEIWY